MTDAVVKIYFDVGVYSCIGSTWCSSAIPSQQAHSSLAWFFHWRKLTNLHGDFMLYGTL